ncbi:MAG: hypothetical protein QOI10_2545 [Solirubrobacterales bacterium]|jgi:hypothetical protein|nr:hypothetical protein [Solirubrobacterales bacterium]
MPEEPTPAQQDSARRLVSALYLSGAITVVAGIALGFVITPVLFFAVALGIVDCVIAGLFSSGRIGPLSARRAAAESGDAAALAEADPNFNPYARED